MANVSINIDEVINARAKAEEVRNKWIKVCFADRPSLKPFNQTPVAHCVPTGMPVPNEEKTMQANNNDYMLRRVRDAEHKAQTKLAETHHLQPDRIPSTVQGILDAMKDGTFRLRAEVKPTDKVGLYDTVNDYFEFRTHEPDLKGFEKEKAKLAAEEQKTRDTLLAHPDQVVAFKAFKSFLEDWEPTGQAN